MELTLFIIIGAVAVIAAAMMLISENAVYSALFLILNFACIAFFFLMLNAPFLAMVQIAVYAGAIMVLFLFVIMLLGAERVLPEAQPRFRWLTPVAILLALVFLITSGVAIINGEIDLIDTRPNQPQVRVVHGMSSFDEIDAYLDGEQLADRVDFRESSGFEAWDPGRYVLTLFEAGSDPETADPLVAPQEVTLNVDDVISFAVVGAVGEARLAVVSEDVSENDEQDMLRVVAVNALHGRDTIAVSVGDTRIEAVPFGAASEPTLVEAGDYTVNVYSGGNDRLPLVTLEDEVLEADTSVLWIFSEEQQSDNSWTNVIVTKETNSRPAFGSPTHVGHILFSKYVLPFEMVALLLLVAMIGAIVLTHERVGPRRQVVRRLANPPAGLDQPITGEPGK